MYSREEKAKIKKVFWTAFGQYMKGVPVVEEDGKKKNWLNFMTGVKGIHFKTDATEKYGYIGIELLHKDVDERQLVYEQFLSLKKILTEKLGEEWVWDADYSDGFGKPFSRIYIEVCNVNVFRQEDWPTLISFFKPRILALNSFWEDVKPMFEDFL